MTEYRYVAIDKKGQRIRGVIDAQSDFEALSKLSSLGIEVIRLSQQRQFLDNFFKKKSVSRKDLIRFTLQLQQLLSAGVPLLSVLDGLSDSFYDKKSLQIIINGIIEDMRNGLTLSESISKYKNVFSPVYVSLVKVGEMTGRLEDVLGYLVDMLKWEDELAAKSKKVMIYPSIVLTVISTVVAILMIFVVPQLLQFIKEMGGELSFATLSLIAVSEFIRNNILFIIAGPILIVFFIKFLRSRYRGFKKWTDCKLLTIPLLGEIIYKIKLSRLANSLAVMYSSGIAFIDSIKLSKNVLNSVCLEDKLESAYLLIQQGAPIYDSFRKADIFPPLAIYILQAGEESGRIDDSLQNIRYFLDRDAKDLIDKIEPAIEPALTIILAMLVLWIMIAILVPVYDTISQIKF